jgi:3-dehydroquinate synthase
VGGGVLTDLGGTLAAMYRRGELNYVSTPTTLLSAVDASISPKVAVNLDYSKNLLGFFYPPASVLMDTSFFRTTTHDSIIDGVTEMIKVAVIGDSPLFEALESKGSNLIKELFQGDFAASMVESAATLFLQLKWHERSRARNHSIRSFGHIFSRSLETDSGFSLSHGQAVAIEMRIALHLAATLGHLGEADRDRILRCFDCLGLARWADVINCDRIWQTIFDPLERHNETFDFPTPCGIGKPDYLDHFSYADLRSAIKSCASEKDVFAVQDIGIASMRV